MAWRKENFGAARTTTNRAYTKRKPRQIEVAGRRWLWAASSRQRVAGGRDGRHKKWQRAQLLHLAMGCAAMLRRPRRFTASFITCEKATRIAVGGRKQQRVLRQSPRHDTIKLRQSGTRRRAYDQAAPKFDIL